MKNEFDERIKRIEQELINLKTASRYASMRPACLMNRVAVNTGVYKIYYDNPSGDPIATFIIADDRYNMAGAYARTPDTSTQIVDMVTSNYEESWTGYVSIISNVPVLRIERIG